MRCAEVGGERWGHRAPERRGSGTASKLMSQCSTLPTASFDTCVSQLLIMPNAREDTYDSASESSVRRLLETLLCSPSDSSLWSRPSSAGLGRSGSGGTSSREPACEASSCTDLRRRLRRPLKSFDIFLRCEEPSLWVPSPEAYISLLAIDVADELMPSLDTVRAGGAASELSLLIWSVDDVVLRARSMDAMAGVEIALRGGWVVSGGITDG